MKSVSSQHRWLLRTTPDFKSKWRWRKVLGKVLTRNQLIMIVWLETGLMVSPTLHHQSGGLRFQLPILSFAITYSYAIRNYWCYQPVSTGIFNGRYGSKIVTFYLCLKCQKHSIYFMIWNIIFWFWDTTVNFRLFVLEVVNLFCKFILTNFVCLIYASVGYFPYGFLQLFILEMRKIEWKH